MRSLLPLLLAFCWCYTLQAQILFSDDFESGTGNWTLTGGYGLSTQFANSGVNSLSESPVGFYPNNLTASATMVNGVNLTTALDATLTFNAVYDIENGFDYGYVDASANGGNTWVNIGIFNGENNLTPWLPYTYSLGGFVANNDVKIRFRFESDGGLQLEGWFIDDVVLTMSTVDNSPPLIVHNEAEHYEGDLDTNTLVAQFIDISGVTVAELGYQVDNGPIQTINATDTTGNTYTYKIPTQLPGAWVDYWFTGTDNAPAMNSVVSDTFSYISGRYLGYDNGVVDFINSYGPNGLSGDDGTAVRITLTGGNGVTNLVSALVRNYTDVNNANDDMVFHVWEDNNGLPGADLITPITVTPEANLAFPNQITRIDLRPYASQLSNLSGDVFIGFTVPNNSMPNGAVFVVQSTPGTANRTFAYDGSSWSQINDDYHFRAVTSAILPPPVSAFTYDNTNDPIIAFTDQSANNPTVWSWNFGDSSPLDSTQNPTHTYANVGTYNVCLTAVNQSGLNTSCQMVTIVNTAPTADFGFNGVGDPTYDFVDFSSHLPTTWLWDFDDQSATSISQNPTHVFSDSGTYNVCLTASNAHGSDMICKTITVNTAKPIANFGWTVNGFNNEVTFTDSSLNIPTSWDWDFDHNSATSSLKNPVYEYPRSGGIFTVCLVSSNQAGDSDPFCLDLNLTDFTVGVDEQDNAEQIRVYPNPASQFVDVEWIDAEAPNGLTVELYTVLGETVAIRTEKRGNGMRLYRDKLPAGIYYYKLLDRVEKIGGGKLIFE